VLAAVGVEVRVVAQGAGGGGEGAGTAQHVFDIVGEGVGADDVMGDAFPAEVNVFVGDIAGSVRFIEDLRACAEPVDFAVGFLDAVAIAVVGVVQPARRLDLAFSIPHIGVRHVRRLISCRVIGESGESDAVTRVDGEIGQGGAVPRPFFRKNKMPRVKSKSAPFRKRRTRHP